ncbi:hypothetical protein VC83_07007 [Pseudogymnoascus destructans]|uniref:Uncharacterized protein n=1 Tax=Pseudogymnoascus destructans TaxID=655981 RepID=A0A177A3P9_9PEZI|nr:uncharacterized protein VC83_07007 [Pseudogymnoascus destructans]OAF56919.1 hypothetical protein VC83_07007 [Pseudogymnoascus destructans]
MSLAAAAIGNLPTDCKSSNLSFDSSNSDTLAEYLGAVYSSNITSLDLPDLQNVTSSFVISHVSSLSSLNLPKPKNVTESLILDLSDGSHQAFLPELVLCPSSRLLHPLSIEFRALNKALSLDIYTTGKLDCAAFLKKLDGVVHTRGQGKTCTSRISKGTTTSSSLRLYTGDSKTSINVGNIKHNRRTKYRRKNVVADLAPKLSSNAKIVTEQDEEFKALHGAMEQHWEEDTSSHRRSRNRSRSPRDSVLPTAWDLCLNPRRALACLMYVGKGEAGKWEESAYGHRGVAAWVEAVAWYTEEGSYEAAWEWQVEALRIVTERYEKEWDPEVFTNVLL